MLNFFLSKKLLGAAHIHDAGNKKQGNKLRRLMTYAWPCLLSKNCVDPATRYHGHLLLSHIIAKFAIHKRIVLQVCTVYLMLRLCLQINMFFVPNEPNLSFKLRTEVTM